MYFFGVDSLTPIFKIPNTENADFHIEQRKIYRDKENIYEKN